MSDKEILTSYLNGVANSKTIIEVAKECKITADTLRKKLCMWRANNIDVPSVRDIKHKSFNELTKVIKAFNAK